MSWECDRCGCNVFIQHEEGNKCALCQAERRARFCAGLVQTNPDWECPYGATQYPLGSDDPKPGPSMGHCPMGFPGCACADDRLAIMCEEGSGIMERMQKRLKAANEALIDLGRKAF